MREFEVWAPQAATGVELLLGDERVPADPRPTAAGGGRPHAAEPGAPYGFSLDGGDPRARPALAAAARGPARARRPSFDPTAVRAGPTRGWTGVELADSVIYELHVGTFTARGHARRGDRAARPPRRPRRHARRADAARGLPGRQRLGLRRRRALRGARAVRRPGRRCSASSTPATRAGSASASTSSTTTSARTATTSASSARTSPTATPRRGARRSTSTAPAATRCARFVRRQRADVAARLPRRRRCASTRSTRCTTTARCTLLEELSREVDALAAERRPAAVR